MTKIQTHIPLTEEQLQAALSLPNRLESEETSPEDAALIVSMLRSIGYHATRAEFVGQNTNIVGTDPIIAPIIARMGHIIHVEPGNSSHTLEIATTAYDMIWQEYWERKTVAQPDPVTLQGVLERYATLAPIPLPMEDGSRGSFGYLMEVASPGPKRLGHLRDHCSIAYSGEDGDNHICHGGGCGGEIRFIRHASDYRSTIVCRNCYYHFTILETYARAYGGLRHQLDMQIQIREPSDQHRRYAEHQLSDNPHTGS